MVDLAVVEWHGLVPRLCDPAVVHLEPADALAPAREVREDLRALRVGQRVLHPHARHALNVLAVQVIDRRVFERHPRPRAIRHGRCASAGGGVHRRPPLTTEEKRKSKQIVRRQQNKLNNSHVLRDVEPDEARRRREARRDREPLVRDQPDEAIATRRVSDCPQQLVRVAAADVLVARQDVFGRRKAVLLRRSRMLVQASFYEYRMSRGKKRQNTNCACDPHNHVLLWSARRGTSVLGVGVAEGPLLWLEGPPKDQVGLDTRSVIYQVRHTANQVSLR